MELDLIALMEKSDSLSDLEKELNGLGYKFETYTDYIKFLRKHWKPISKQRAKQVLDNPILERRLPSTHISNGDTEYFIHGIVHGGSVYTQPGFHLRKRVRDFIKSETDSFHNPETGKMCLYEENFSVVLDIDYKKELRDVTTALDSNLMRAEPVSDMGCIISAIGCFISIPLIIPLLVLQPPLNLFLYFNSITGVNKTGNVQIKALRREEFQKVASEYFQATQMPQPIDLELNYIRLAHTRRKNKDFITRQFQLMADIMNDQKERYGLLGD